MNGSQPAAQRRRFSAERQVAKILEEKIADCPSGLDVIRVSGYGWPVYIVGPLLPPVKALILSRPPDINSDINNDTRPPITIDTSARVPLSLQRS